MENIAMIISEGTRQEEATFSRLLSHLNTPSNSSSAHGYYGAPLPVGNYIFTFKDRDSGTIVWPNYAELNFQKPPDCNGYADETMVTLRKPDFDADQCEQLIVDGDLENLPDPAGGMGAWHTQYLALELVTPGFGEVGIAIKGKGGCRGPHCTLQQWLDSSCFVSWTKYEFAADVRLVDAEGHNILCDENDLFGCVVVWLQLDYFGTGESKKYEIGRIVYPGNTQNGWYHLSGQFTMDDETELPDKGANIYIVCPLLVC